MDSRLQGFVPFGRFLPRLGPLLGAAFFYAGSGSRIHHRCSGGQRTCFHREAISGAGCKLAIHPSANLTSHPVLIRDATASRLVARAPSVGL